MLIDSHTHIGTILDFDLPQEALIRTMDRYGVDRAVVSNIEGAEFDHSCVPLGKDVVREQIGVNQVTIDFAKSNPGRIFPLVWVMPATGGVTEDFKRFITQNRNDIYGLKFHPYLNQSPVDSELALPYIRLAAEYDLPVVVHTASSDESDPLRVESVARAFPGTRFLLVHMGLYTDNEESINLILKYPNIYGDTTWVKPQNAMRLIGRGGAEKIMFGTDALVLGEDDYLNEQNRTYIYEWRNVLSSEDHAMLLSENAVKFFGIGGK